MTTNEEEESVLHILLECLHEALRYGHTPNGHIDPALILRRRTWTLAATFGVLALRQLEAADQRKTCRVPTPIDACQLQPSETPEAALAMLGQVFGQESAFGQAGRRLDDERLNVKHFLAKLMALPPCMPLHTLYERVLGYDPVTMETGAALREGKSARNRSGSYYTPPNLADAVVELAIREIPAAALPQSTGSTHHWSDFRVIDLSCGPGSLLLRFIKRLTTREAERFTCDDDRRQFVKALTRTCWGADVDPVALDLARAGLALQADDVTVVGLLAPQFILGNPLLSAEVTEPFDVRLRHAAEGFVYDEALATSPAQFNRAFDLVLGNPPWERIRIEERAFFSAWAPGISAQLRKGDRSSAIEHLETEQPCVRQHFLQLRKRLTDAATSMSADPRLQPAVHGELNSYALFTALACACLKSAGAAVLIVKSAIATTTQHRELLDALVRSERLVAFFDFTNRARLFDIDSRERFALLVLGKNYDGTITFAAGLTAPAHVTDDERVVRVPLTALRQLNPATGVLPAVTSAATLRFLLDLITTHPTFADIYPRAQIGRLVHLTTHDKAISLEPAAGRIPIAEGKFIEQYDGRFATFAGVPVADRLKPKARARRLRPEERHDPSTAPESRFYLSASHWHQLSTRFQGEFSIVWRSTTSSSNRRTLIATILPHGPAIQSLYTMQLPGYPASELAIVLAVLNSTTLDYVLREKLTGIDITGTVLRQLPMPTPSVWEQRVIFAGSSQPLRAHVGDRVGELLQDDARLWPFLQALKLDRGSGTVNRHLLRRELDVLIAFAYGISREQLSVLEQTFPSALSAADRAWVQSVQWPTLE